MFVNQFLDDHFEVVDHDSFVQICVLHQAGQLGQIGDDMIRTIGAIIDHRAPPYCLLIDLTSAPSLQPDDWLAIEAVSCALSDNSFWGGISFCGLSEEHFDQLNTMSMADAFQLFESIEAAISSLKTPRHMNN
jgi:hypothetical protein